MSDNVVNRLTELKRPSQNYPRKFVPADAQITNWESIEPFYLELLNRPLNSVSDIEKWLEDGSELGAIIGEEGSRRYILMTCATDDAEREKAYLDFIENVEPKLKPLDHKMNEKLLNCPHTKNLDEKKYKILLRSVKNSIELFRQENVPLQTEVGKLSQQYQKLSGTMTVTFKGEEKTLQQMGKYLEENDRQLRKEAWEAVTNRRMLETEKMEEIFDKMLALRQQIAKNAGFDNYRDYTFRAFERFDYTPQDCFAFHNAVEQHVVPLTRQILEERRISMGLDTVRPWDSSCDRFGRPPLKPFDNTRKLVDGCLSIFNKVDKSLGDQFKIMIDTGILDLDSRKGKAPGGYQSSLNELRLPFIFMNAVGTNRDVFTLLHEGGHAFHAFAAKDQPLLSYRHAPMEFCEVASMSMEHLAGPYLGEFYDKKDAARAWRNALEGDVGLLPWIAIVDAFQHWIYTHPGHTREERADHFQDLMHRFGSGVDWSGYEEASRYRWQAQLHIFEYPFYYIEYGIALLGALQVWRNALTDLPGAVKAYKHGLSLGGSKPLPELFTAAGIKFDFSSETIRPLVSAVQKEVEVQGKLEYA